MNATSPPEEVSDGILRGLLDLGLANTTRKKDLGAYRAGPYAFRVSGPVTAETETMCSYLVPAERGAVTDLHIHLVDGNGIAPPRWNLPHSSQRHLERLHISDDGLLAGQYDTDREIWQLFDRSSSTAVLWATSLAKLPSWDIAAPFRTLLQWFLAPTPYVTVHAGAVEGRDGGCLIVGAGGSGKSTTVAASLAAGYRVCGDDLVVVGAPDGVPTVFSLYNAIKLDAASQLFAGLELSKAPAMISGDKSVFRYSDIAPSKLALSLPINALVHTEVAHLEHSILRPANQASVLRALGPSTVFLLRGFEQSSLQKISLLVRRLPGYSMRLSTSPTEVASALFDMRVESAP